MIQTIGIETLRVLVEEQDLLIEGREGVKEIFSDVLEYEDLEVYPSQQISVFSDASVDDKRHKNEDTESVPPYLDAVDAETELRTEHTSPVPEEPRVVGTTEPVLSPDPETVIISKTPAPEAVSQPPSVSPDALPARALYKNFNGLAIKERFEKQTNEATSQNGLPNYTLVTDSEEQVEFIDVENERYIRVTEERLQLHTRSEAELSIAMAEVETQCTSALMYLAKTIEERG